MNANGTYRAHRSLRALARDERGSTAVLAAAIGMVLVGFAGLGIDVGNWYLAKRTMQTAADTAAISAAFEYANGNTGTDALVAAAQSAATANGYHGAACVANSSSSTVGCAVNRPPTTGPFTGNTSAIEVVIHTTPPTFFANAVFGGAVNVTSRGVSTVASGGAARGGGSICVLGLDTAAMDTVTLGNNAAMPNTQCGVAANSTSAKALDLANNATIAGPVAVKGNWYLSNNASLTNAHKSTGVSTADPYAAVTRDALPACTAQVASAGNGATVALTPGYFCAGWTFGNNVTLNLSPGTYYVGSQLSLFNNAALNATGGVTIVVVGNYALNIGNNATVNLTAPATGPYAGIALFGDRTAPQTVTQVFSNNTVMNIKGAVYFPNQIIDFQNNATTGATGCTQIIGRRVVLSNNVTLDNACAGTGVKPIGPVAATMLE